MAGVDTSRAPQQSSEVAPGPAEADIAAAAAISDASAPAASPSAELAKSDSGVAGLAAVGLIAIILIVLASAAFYFLPTLIAFGRRKRNAGAILALNLFLGWTLLGWVLALVWSLSVDPPAPAGARPA